jgi:hypothetical protein
MEKGDHRKASSKVKDATKLARELKKSIGVCKKFPQINSCGAKQSDARRTDNTTKIRKSFLPHTRNF